METLAILATLLLVILVVGAIGSILFIHNPIVALTLIAAVAVLSFSLARKLDR